MRISENCIYLDQNEIPTGITLQGMADFLAPHFGGDRAMHHYMIREVGDTVVLYYTPDMSEADGCDGPFSCLNGWGEAGDPFFEADDEYIEDDQELHVATPDKVNPRSARKRAPSSVIQLVNLLREERGLPKVKRPRKPGKITREVIKDICTQVWKDKYPRALTDADFVLGEFTVKLVEQEVERRIAILKGDLIPLKR